jgi:hypothetical protein
LAALITNCHCRPLAHPIPANRGKLTVDLSMPSDFDFAQHPCNTAENSP